MNKENLLTESEIRKSSRDTGFLILRRAVTTIITELPRNIEAPVSIG
jgi:hypothetical protein